MESPPGILVARGGVPMLSGRVRQCCSADRRFLLSGQESEQDTAATAEPITRLRLAPLRASADSWTGHIPVRDCWICVPTWVLPILALPISGLIFLSFGRSRLKSLTKSTPDDEGYYEGHESEEEKMNIVCGVRNCEACVDAPTVIPREYCDYVGECVGGCFGQTCSDSAFAQEVTEEQHSQQRQA